MIKNKSTESQIAMMKHLINYGKVEENKTKQSAPVVEYQKKAANGKTYGIIREATKYYIMEAPEKNTEVLAEDFSYIGGFNNRRENEYSSYTKASNALTLKLKLINETVDRDKQVLISKPLEKADWETKITESMRSDIERFKTITTNAKRILKEEKGDIIPSEHTVPEAPAKNPSDKKVNSPFTDTAVAKGDKDFKEEEHDHTQAGTPFKENGEVSNKDMQDDKNKKGEEGEVYTEKAQYVPDGSVANQHPSGGKEKREDESFNRAQGKRLKLTLEQVLAWNDNKDYMDKSVGTEIGSSEPFVDELGEESNQTEADTQPVHEGVAVHNTDNQNKPTPGTNEVGDGQPFEKKVNEDIIEDPDDVAGFDDEEEEDFSDFPFPERAREDYGEGSDDEELEFDVDLDDVPEDTKYSKNALRGLENWENDWNKFDDDDDDYGFYESRRRNGRRMNEDVMNDFGKHPAFTVVPMTTPPNKEVAINGAHEWDDESVAQEKQFGTEVGDGQPFDEIVDTITDAIVEAYNKKKV
jgi:hypothetical protein